MVSSVEEWDRWQPILGTEPRTCAKCGEQTLWRGRLQPKLGTCLDCQPYMGYTPEVAAELHERAMDLILEHLGPCEIGPPRAREVRAAKEPRWLLLRGYWIVERRWDQKWIWCSPEEAAPLMKKRYE